MKKTILGTLLRALIMTAFAGPLAAQPSSVDAGALLAAARSEGAREWARIAARGADLSVVDGTPAGNTLLHVAAQYNPDPGVIDLLVKSGINVNVPNKFNETALFYAALNPSPEAARRLIALGATTTAISSFGLFPLAAAAFYGQPETYNIIRDAMDGEMRARGLKPMTPTLLFQYLNDGKPFTSSLLACAASNKNQAIVDQMLKFALSPGGETSPLGIFEAAALTTDSPRVWDALLSAPAKPSQAVMDRTLVYAVCGNSIAVVGRLLSWGASPNADDGEGFSALMAAAKYRPEVVFTDTLIRAGAKPSVGLNQAALILAAVHSKNPDVVSSLLNAGADPTLVENVWQPDSVYEIALRNTAIASSPVVLRLKLANDLPSQLREAQTELHNQGLATYNGNQKFFQLLKAASLSSVSYLELFGSRSIKVDQVSWTSKDAGSVSGVTYFYFSITGRVDSYKHCVEYDGRLHSLIIRSDDKQSELRLYTDDGRGFLFRFNFYSDYASIRDSALEVVPRYEALRSAIARVEGIDRGMRRISFKTDVYIPH